MVGIDKVIPCYKLVSVFAGADPAVADGDDGHNIPSGSSLVAVPTVPVASAQAPPQLHAEHAYSLIDHYPEPAKRVTHSPEPCPFQPETSRPTTPKPMPSVSVTPEQKLSGIETLEPKLTDQVQPPNQTLWQVPLQKQLSWRVIPQTQPSQQVPHQTESLRLLPLHPELSNQVPPRAGPSSQVPPQAGPSMRVPSQTESGQTPLVAHLPLQAAAQQFTAQSMVQNAQPASTVNEPVKKPPNKRRKRKPNPAAPVYLCPFCRKACVDINEIICEEANSIQCDKCNEWMHWGCVGYTNNVASDEWFCPACTM